MVDPDSAEVTLYTLGHSDRDFDEWAALLRRRKIDVVAVVRSHTCSLWVRHFGRDALQTALSGYLGKKLGVRRGKDLAPPKLFP